MKWGQPRFSIDRYGQKGAQITEIGAIQMENPSKPVEIADFWDLYYRALELARQLDGLIAVADRGHGGIAVLDRLVAARSSHARTVRSLAAATELKPRAAKRKRLFAAVGTASTPAGG
jgi:hypothetical protein